jgi:hypothetical protein
MHEVFSFNSVLKYVGLSSIHIQRAILDCTKTNHGVCCGIVMSAANRKNGTYIMVSSFIMPVNHVQDMLQMR